MSTSGSRCAATAVPLLALVASQFTYAADATSAPRPPAAAASASAPAPWKASDLLAPLREFGVESWWDIVQFAPWTGTLGFGFDDQAQRFRVPDSADQHYGSRLAEERFTIANNSIALVDPRLFKASVRMGLTRQRQWLRVLGSDMSQQATLDNYSFDGTLLPERPYNLNLVAVRAQNTYALPSGATTRSDIANRGITLRLLETSFLRDRQILPYFSASLALRQEDVKQATTTGGQTYSQDDKRDQLSLDLHNGGETSDLSFQYQFTRLENHAYQAGSYRSQSANAVYSVDFGPTLNRRSDSRLNYYTRRGEDRQSDISTIEFNEFLTIDHNVNLSSNYNYQFTRQETPLGNVTTQNLSAQVTRQVFLNLSVAGGASALYSVLPGGTMSSTGATGNFSYSHTLPWGGQFSAAGGGGYTLNSSRVPGGLVQVADAPYAVPSVVGAGSSILLTDRNIVVPSISVVVVKSGTRAPAVLNVDYTVTVDGDRVSIVPLAGSAVMLPGDPLNVSYEYQVPSDSKFRTVSNSASVGADWGWIGVNFNHDASDQQPLSGGDDTLLFEQRRDTGGIHLSGEWHATETRAGLTIVRFESTRLAYRERRFDQRATYRPSYAMQLSLAANQYRTEYELPVHTTSGNDVRIDLQWRSASWLTTAYASRRSYRDTQQPVETVSETGLRVRRSWTKLDANAWAAVQRRIRGGIESLNASIHIDLTRRF